MSSVVVRSSECIIMQEKDRRLEKVYGVDEGGMLGYLW